MDETKLTIRHILTAAVFIVFVAGFFILQIAVRPPNLHADENGAAILDSEGRTRYWSASERRLLAPLPALSLGTVAEFTETFESYAADNFTFRDSLRAVRAVTVLDIFRQSDKSGLYYGKSGAGRLEKIKENELRMAAEKIRKVSETLDGVNLYYSFIPDKSVYSDANAPGFDPALAARILGEQLPALQFIDLVPALTADSFYKTDLHWNQTKIDGVVAALASAMAFTEDTRYTPHEIGPFTGVYAGQLALPMPADKMTYFTNPSIDSAKVTYLTDEGMLAPGEVYEAELFGGGDPYDFFLGGAQNIVTLENPNAPPERELYLFRDSFSSSLAPRLIGGYSKIYLIDLRYVDSRVLPLFVRPKAGADALFLYSSQVLNNAAVLKVE